MNEEMESTEPQVSLRDEAVSFLEGAFSGAESQGQPEAAAVEPVEGQPEASEDEQSLDGESGESEESESKDEGGKKPGRFQKLKQRAQSAESERDTLRSQVEEALDHVAYYQAQLQTASERMAEMEKTLEEAGYGLTDEQRELQVLKAKQQGEAHYRAAAKAAQERQAQAHEQAQAMALKAELDEAATEFGLEWKTVAALAAQPEHLDKSIREVAQLLAGVRSGAANTPEVRQVAKNQAVPAVVNRTTGNVAQQDHKPGTREHAAALLRESGLFN
jgi:DNA repair exonuclease SbcCD ATPase subunit